MIATEADPTPLVLSLARTLRASVRVPELRDLVAQTNGSVSLKSVTDAQSATLTFDGSGVLVSHGLAFGAEPVDLAFDPEYTVGETADPVARAAAKLLSPPLPDWRVAGAHFWEVSQGTPGFPGRLVLVCLEEEAELVFGEGDDVYEVHGYGPALAAVLSGQIDHFLYAVGFGVVSVVGSGAHLSAMCGAHWKVRFGG
ncbi:hypothetical protein [Nocardioides antri]|uniref:Uncharacterized protein n=1 Tax=Nocardioides antri TaxID=2607659 RepID=A0A5B1M5D8_9ACTN|nr:hypothetical protein [Nocardioides antri]KAA1427846.1 hypothetical protein F0U47_10520 [Nocardioides antri]